MKYALVLILSAASVSLAAKPVQLAGVPCVSPPPSHCPDANCPGPLVIEQGAAVEPKTGRKFFLDYPCDLKKNEKVTFILSLHGAGSYGNWQRHYFPLLDFVRKYRLVVATPNSPARFWTSEADDAYLQNIVELVYTQIGQKNVKAFWLAGHSQGGMTSNRLVRTDFFKTKVDGFLSLSGGRIGGSPGRAATFGPPRNLAPAASTTNMAAAIAALQKPPDNDFSFIFTTGRFEMDDKGLPDSSAWAERYGCSSPVRSEIVDTKAGYVYDGTRQDPGSDAWGRLPRPGKAELIQYMKCRNGRVVADVVRQEKGHTEGLEPNVTEKLIQLMLSAKPKK
jgi:pimeloyl-ACP methyl ester carboxylesterase